MNHTMKQEITPSQAQIFFDGFESGSFGLNWKKYCRTSNCVNSWTVATTNPYQGIYHAQVKQPGAGDIATLEFGFNTEAYLNITLRYYRRLVGLDAVDSYSAEWWNGTAWKLLESKPDGSGSEDNPAYVYKSFNLDSSANDNPNFKVRFNCEAGAVSEFCRLDNFELLGVSFTSKWRYTQSTSSMISGAHNYKVYATDFSNNTAISSTETFTLN